MLSAYRVIDATDHRGQLAGMILAGLGAEVILAEPPGGAPHRARGYWGASAPPLSASCVAQPYPCSSPQGCRRSSRHACSSEWTIRI